MKTLTKKGNVFGLDGFAKGIVGLAVIVGIGMIILATLSDSRYTLSATCNKTSGVYTSCPEVQNTDLFITKLGDMPTWVGILLVGVVGSIVLAVISRNRG